MESSRLTYPKALSDKLDVDYHQKLIVKFQIKDQQGGEFLRVQQAFLRFINKKSNKEVIYLAEATGGVNALYKVEVVRENMPCQPCLTSCILQGFDDQCEWFPSSIRCLWTVVDCWWCSLTELIHLEIGRSNSIEFPWERCGRQGSSRPLSTEKRNHPSIPWRRETPTCGCLVGLQCFDSITSVGSFGLGKETTLEIEWETLSSLISGWNSASISPVYH